MTETVFHIGLPKTGSKTLQKQLFAQHSGIEYLGGVTVGEVYEGDIGALKRELFDQLIWEHKFEPDFPRCREIYEQVIAPMYAEGRVPVFSWESLVEDTHEVQRLRARNLSKIFGSCRILAVLRHPLHLTESLYVQLLRRDNVGTFARRFQAHRFEEIDHWLEQNWGRLGEPPSAQLEYAESIRVFANEFGEDAVKVLLFEELAQDPRGFFRTVCDWIGVDAEEGAGCVRATGDNPRMGERQIELLRGIDASAARALRFRLSGVQRRLRILELDPDGFPRGANKARPKISSAWQQKIADATSAGNRWLRDTWGLPLEKYGYPT